MKTRHERLWQAAQTLLEAYNALSVDAEFVMPERYPTLDNVQVATYVDNYGGVVREVLISMARDGMSLTEKELFSCLDLQTDRELEGDFSKFSVRSRQAKEFYRFTHGGTSYGIKRRNL